MGAFVLRVAPSGLDRVREALEDDELILGWSHADGLLDLKLNWGQFRRIVSDTYYSGESNLRKAGAASGHLWRFIRSMEIGDLVVVPRGSKFYVAEVSGPARYLDSKISEDTAYRRPVKWLNNKKAIPRKYAKAALTSRMKTQGTCASANDLLPQIKECLSIAGTGVKPSFERDLRARLVSETLAELRSGRMESYAFENLIKEVLLGLGATEASVVPRSKDKGADILATFSVAGIFQQKVAVQAKHWQAKPALGPKVVGQLIDGLEAEAAQHGMVVTSGTVSEAAIRKAAEYSDATGVVIELVDGEQFAKLVVEHYVSNHQ
ncbi:restriction endonuclease [Salinisphaera dokdonensis CL-ES53]|uniref:Restriction endonuclease n=1 Tax=Salinisphaera dokdonensis CL-ES53 TaxID=1304272 RepID=A0ABV2AZJ2_9GAMM